jgi:hypothetical protein
VLHLASPPRRFCLCGGGARLRLAASCQALPGAARAQHDALNEAMMLFCAQLEMR